MATVGSTLLSHSAFGFTRLTRSFASYVVVVVVAAVCSSLPKTTSAYIPSLPLSKSVTTSTASATVVFPLDLSSSTTLRRSAPIEFIRGNSSPSLDNRSIFLTTTLDRRLAYGDYSEIPETCPGLTTCQPICVAQVSDCPTSCDEGLVLCNDGTCASSDSGCDPTLVSPCYNGGCVTLPIACAKVIQYLEDCQDNFAEQYEALDACNAEYVEALPQVSFTGFWFLFCYYWISLVTTLVIGWCFYNQKLVPLFEQSIQVLNNVTGTTDDSIKSKLKTSSNDNVPIEHGVSIDKSVDAKLFHQRPWTITGYKTNFVGLFISTLVWITLWGIQFLLFLLTVFYYQQQGVILRWPIVFYDEVQVLAAFELVWIVGIFWSLAFQWPDSIASLFLRRCSLAEATHVAVYAPVKKVELTATDRKSSYGQYFASTMWYPIDICLRTLFSYPFTYNPDYETLFCSVDRTETTIPSFYYRMKRYVYDETQHTYIEGSMSVGATISDFLQQKDGLSETIASQNYNLVGQNTFPLKKPTRFGNLLKEFGKSYYVYQNFLVWTWFPYWFWYMALANTIIRLVAGTVVAMYQYKSDLTLYQLSFVEGTVEVIRDNVKKTISMKHVVPGDVVVLKSGTVHCDMVILKSKHLVVDENAMTGESTPVIKDRLDPTLNHVAYDPVQHKVHTLFAGTEIIECSSDDNDDDHHASEELGLVIATGSYTVKGKLVSDILSYKRHQFLFDDEIKIVLLILFIQATILITLVFQWLEGQFVYAFFYGAFILATVLPPLLPTVFIVSVGISAERLLKDRITCINPDNLLVAGKVNVCCLDKTGTLTEQSMECIGVDCCCSEDDNNERVVLTKLGMAVCHGLKPTSLGELIGNHVDKAIFANSGGTIMVDPTSNSQNVAIEVHHKRYTIVKQLEFDNHRQTQCVIVQAKHDGSTHIFVKGSPESIRKRCQSETIPPSFDETLDNGSKSGLYQLAIGYKEYNDSASKDYAMLTRDEIESNLTFCGFINFRNQLKEETLGLIDELKGGNILTTMITGDNVMTGICVAKESGIVRTNQSTTILLGQVSSGSSSSVEWIDVDNSTIVDKPLPCSTPSFDLAMTGDAWTTLVANDYEYALSIAKYVRVFGRCNPVHKVSVITALVQLGYITLMCGDGQNDCGALKTAHVGVALSSAASIVAPFSSIDKNVASVSRILKEGRCALSSAFKAYTFYLMYGQVGTLLQTINARLFITFGGWCWIFLDGIYSSTLAFTLPLAHAATKLTPRRPTASLLGPRTMFSACGMLAINYLFVVIGLIALNQQEWYPCRKWNSEDVSDVGGIGDNYESSVLYIVGAYQYIASAMALNFGYTFRAPWYTNTIFLLFAITFTVIHFTMTLYPSEFSCLFRVNCDNTNTVTGIGRGGPMPIQNLYNTTVMPMDFRIILVAIMISNFICLCAWEYLFVNGYLYKRYKFGNDDPLSETTDPGSYPSGSLKKVDDTMNNSEESTSM